MKPYIFLFDPNDPVYWNYYVSGDSPQEIINGGAFYGESSFLKSVYSGVYDSDAILNNYLDGTPSVGKIYKLTPINSNSDGKNFNLINKLKSIVKQNTNNDGKQITGNILLFIVLMSSLFLIGSGCVSSKNLTGRYKAQVVKLNEDKFISDFVKVQGYVLPVPATPSQKTSPVTPMNLDPKVQKELVKKIEAHQPDPEKMIKLLGTKVIDDEKDEPNPFVNRTLFSKRLVLSIRNQSPLPEDRISKLEVIVSNVDTNLIRFKGCDKIITELQIVDQGKLTFKNTVNGEINAGANLGGTGSLKQNYKKVNANGDTVLVETNGGTSNGANISGKLGFTNESYEEAMLKQRYISLTAGIGATSASFYQETVAGIDLSGNIIADIQFEIFPYAQIQETRYAFGNLFDASGGISPNALVTFSRKYVTIPRPGVIDSLLKYDLKLKVKYIAVYRKVISGGNTLIEGDDSVQYIKGSGTAEEELLLLTKEETKSHKWSIVDNVGNKLEFPNSLSGQNETLYFDSYQSAMQFISWLKKSPTSMNAFTNEGIVLYLNNNILNSIIIGQLKLKVD